MHDSRLLPRIARLLYTHNPFYLISAGLVLLGIHKACRHSSASSLEPWYLGGALQRVYRDWLEPVVQKRQHGL